MIIIEAARQRQARRRMMIRRTVMSALLVSIACSIVFGNGWLGSGRGSADTNPQRTDAPTETASLLLAAPQPSCITTSFARAEPLESVSTASVGAHGYPFDVQTTAGGDWSFATVISPTSSSVAVFSDRSIRPRYVRSIELPADALGEVLTPDGKYLLVATVTGVAVVDVARAESGASDAFTELLTNGAPGTESWQVAVSPNGHYAFVTYPGLGVGVFDLAKALTKGFSPSDALGIEPIIGAQGVAVSPNGHWLYVTSYPDSLVLVDLWQPESPAVGGTNSALGSAPPFALGSTVSAGCLPTAVTTSKDGRLVWVTASSSDQLLGFSAARLVSDARHARVAQVRVGVAPDGLALFDHDQRIVVADADWGAFGTGEPKGSSSNLVVVNATAALTGRPAIIGSVNAGPLPRGLALEANGTTLLVASSQSLRLEAVDLASLIGSG